MNMKDGIPKVRTIFRKPNEQPWQASISRLSAVYFQYISAYENYLRTQTPSTNLSSDTGQSKTDIYNHNKEESIHSIIVSNNSNDGKMRDGLNMGDYENENKRDDECVDEEDDEYGPDEDVRCWMRQMRREVSRYLHPDKRRYFEECYPGQTPPSVEWYAELMDCFEKRDYVPLFVLFADHLDWIRPIPPSSFNQFLIRLSHIVMTYYAKIQ